MKLEKMRFMYTNDITAVDKKQYEEHLKLYEGYINKINEIDEVLLKNPEYEGANATYSHFRGLKRGETFALDGVILHELYFENFGGMMKEPEILTLKSLAESFPSFESWRDDFVATARASRGWAILVFDQRSRRFRNISLDAHDVGNVTLSFPILVLDVYEHAYFLQYGTDKNQYIDRFMDNINWGVVNRRMGRV